jgi:hypothetical protein
VPHFSISYIYQSIGCQHSLEPTKDDFAAPSIPALTLRGFVRWQSIETLLGPEEHVPFLQTAVRNFAIKNPDTGEPFPVDLPSESLPQKADPLIERWHNHCAEKLRQQATPDELDEPNVRPTLPPRPDIRSGFAYMRKRYHGSHMRKTQSTPGRSPVEKQDGVDYFTSRSAQALADGAGVSPRAVNSRDSTYRTHLSPHDESPRTSRARRRSVPENYFSSPHGTPLVAEPIEVPPRRGSMEDHTRRHSHPRHRRVSTSSSSSDDEGVPTPASPHTSRRNSPPETKRSSGAPPIIRYSIPNSTTNDSNSTVPISYPPSSTHNHSPSHAPAPTIKTRHRGTSMPYSRERLAAYKIPIDLSGKLSAPFLRSAAGNVRYLDSLGRSGSGASSAANSRSNSKNRDREKISGGVRWGGTEINEFRRRSSVHSVDSDNDEDLKARDLRRRKTERIERPRLIERRSGSHDGRYNIRDEERRDRERAERGDVGRRERRRAVSPDARERRLYGEVLR